MKMAWTGLGLGAVGLYGVLFALASGVGSMAYFHFGNPRHTCASCHEMTGVHRDWSASAHHTLHCRSCHGGSLTLDAHALSAHVNRVVQHFAGDVTGPIRLSERDLLTAHDACGDCHPQSLADWQRGGHAATYSRFFLDASHNRVEPPAEDCLRCHGMFFDGVVSDLVTRPDTKGQCSFKDPQQAVKPAIPCLACHQIHTPAAAGHGAKSHFYDSREKCSFAVTALPELSLDHGDRPVETSGDPRQRLCVQCHAPSAAGGYHPGSSDDRTPLGVHEGLSCLDCHQPHSNSAKDSCATCHPQSSHCGLDVERMDTTFFSAKSQHDIHTVACRDCHPEGRP